ncbi:MAG: hypothetical protein E7174_04635, partial [Firmicutes bacterium]|nr:hypothetical protein [Bacillota bacterium]
TLNNPSKEGYTFKGWKVNGEESNGKIEQGTIGNLSFEAIFTANQYQISYIGNTSTSGSMNNSTHYYGTSSNLTSNSYNKEYTITYKMNYSSAEDQTNTVSAIFKGWSTSSNGEVIYTDKASITNLTIENNKVINLYAIWENTSTTHIIPTREGYVFGGWYKEESFITEVTDSTTISSNMTLYAKWNIIPKLESLNFKIYTTSDCTELHPQSGIILKGINTFNIQIPQDGVIDTRSLQFVTNTPITLNENAEAPNTNYEYITADRQYNGKYKIELSSMSLDISTLDGGKTWVGSNANGSGSSDPVEASSFFRIVTKNIGVVKDFGITSEGVGTPLYLTTKAKVGGSTYFFFYESGTKLITVNFKYGEKTVESILVPYGTMLPEFNDIKLSGFKFNDWYSDSNLTSKFDFSKPIVTNANSINIYGDYEALEVDTDWYDESASSYILCKDNDLNSRAELKGFASLVSLGTTFSGKTVNLNCDIDLLNEEWTPISENFKGTFNGNGHIISNLKITQIAENQVGFFSKLSGATVENLKFNNITINSSTSQDIGTLAGSTSGTTIINRISINNAILNGTSFAGGLIGSAGGTTTVNEINITNSQITATGTDTGGVIGIGGGVLTISNVFADIDVEAQAKGIAESLVTDSGGILGNYNGSAGNIIMSNLIYIGKFKSDKKGWLGTSANGYTGAIYGRIGTGSMNDSLSGNMDKSTWFYNKDTIGTSYSAQLNKGTGKTTLELHSSSTYDSSWSAWNTNVSGSYPILKWLQS